MADELLLIKIVGKDETAQAFGQYAKNASEAYKKVMGGASDYERAADRAEQLTKKFYHTLDTGGRVSKATVDSMVAAQHILNLEIERAEKIAGHALPEMRKHQEAYGEVVKRTQGFVAEVNNTIGDQRGALTQAGVQWMGVGNAIERAAGSYGPLVAKAGVAALAVREVYGIFERVGEFIGVDYEERDSFLSGMQTLAREANTRTVELLASVQAVQDELNEGDIGGAAGRVGNVFQTITDNALRAANVVGILNDELYKAARGGIGIKDVDSGRRKFVAVPYTGETALEQFRREFAESENRQDKAMEYQATLKREAEAQQRAAEAAANATRARENAAAAMRLQLAALTDLTPIQRIELEYEEAVAAARRNHTGAMRAQAMQIAELTRLKKIDAQFGPILGMVDPSITRGTVDLARSRYADQQQNVVFFDQFVANARAAGRQWVEDSAEVQRHREDSERKLIEEWRSAYESFRNRIADVFADLALTGGENFGTMAGQRFAELTQKGFETLFTTVFGAAPQYDPTTGKWTYGGQEFDSEKAAWGAAGRKAQFAQAGMDFAMIGAGAYSGARAGDGARTAGVASGAASGASIGSVIPALGTAMGAIVGAIIGLVGGYLGEKERQSEYKYGIPTIDEKGRAHINAGQNLSPGEADQMLTQVQETYDYFRNAYVKILLKIPESILPEILAIDGKFQDNPSGKFLKHFGEWVSGTLPDDIAEMFQGSLRRAFKGLGFNTATFDALWAELDDLDPKKTAALWAELMDAMITINESMEFFDNSWRTNVKERRRLMGRGTDEILKEDYFDKIMEYSRALDALTGEERIHALSEIARLQREAADVQKAALDELIRSWDNAREQFRNAKDELVLMGMRKEDGSPDLEAQAEFYRQRAARAYDRIKNATTTEELERAQAEYREAIMAIVELGYDINSETGEAWRQWALKQMEIGSSATDEAYKRLGTKIENAGQEFIDQFGPVLNTFTHSVEDTRTSIDDFRRGIRDVIDPLREARDGLLSFVDVLRGFGSDDDRFHQSTVAGRRIA